MTTDWDALNASIQSAGPLCNVNLKPRKKFGRFFGIYCALQRLDAKTFSVFSSGRTTPRLAFKFVVFDDADYAYARTTAARYPHIPVYLQPGQPMPPSPEDDATARLHWLVEKTLSDSWFTATVLPQLHVLLWGHRRGV